MFSACARAQTNDQIISRLISQGKLQEAQARLEQSNPTEVDRLFFQGRVQKFLGRLPEAIETFRGVLRRNPRYINAQRELAHTLLLAKEYQVAEFHFEQLLKIDNNETMRDGYRHFLNIIDANKPFGFSTHFSLIPSSNINRGSSKATFDTSLGQFVIDPDSRESSGIGAQVGGSGYFRYPLNAEDRLVISLSGIGTKYSNDNFDQATGVLSLSYEEILSEIQWRVTPYFRYTWRGDDSDNQAVGINAHVDQRIFEKDTVGLTLTHEYRKFPNLGYQDGSFSAVRGSVRHQFDSDLAVFAGVGGSLSLPDAEHLQYVGYRAFAGISKVWEGGIHSGAEIYAGKREYIGEFPFLNEPRQDGFQGVSFSIYSTKLHYKKYTPKLLCNMEFNQSNIDLYDYNFRECFIYLTKNF